MNTFRFLAMGAALVAGLLAQGQRQANIVGGGSPDRGKCTVQVVVDDVAQVEVRGTTASLRTLQGQPAQLRRFECTSPMPANPQNFRFAGVDGRGRQELVRDPRNGGVAVVQIEDRDGGAGEYTFETFWGAGDGRFNDESRSESNRYRQEEPVVRPENRDGEYYRRYGHSFGTDEAVRVCQQQVLTQASRRFRTRDIHFSRTRIDDNPGRQDWVVGTLDVYRGPREEQFRFSCSVNFDNGRVRTADLDERPVPYDRR